MILTFWMDNGINKSYYEQLSNTLRIFTYQKYNVCSCPLHQTPNPAPTSIVSKRGGGDHKPQVIHKDRNKQRYIKYVYLFNTSIDNAYPNAKNSSPNFSQKQPRSRIMPTFRKPWMSIPLTTNLAKSLETKIKYKLLFG